MTIRPRRRARSCARSAPRWRPRAPARRRRPHADLPHRRRRLGGGRPSPRRGLRHRPPRGVDARARPARPTHAGRDRGGNRARPGRVIVTSPHEDLVGGLARLADVLVHDVVAHRPAVPGAGGGGAESAIRGKSSSPCPGRPGSALKSPPAAVMCRTGAIGVVVVLRARVRGARQGGGEDLQRYVRRTPGQVECPVRTARLSGRGTQAQHRGGQQQSGGTAECASLPPGSRGSTFREGGTSGQREDSSSYWRASTRQFV